MTALVPQDAARSAEWLRLFPERASTWATEVDRLYVALVVFSAALVLGLAGTALVFVVRYRAGAEADRSEQVRRTAPYELAWILVPTAIAFGLFGWGAQGYLEMARPPADAHRIYVTAKQWMWKVRHPQGRREIDALHVPVGEPVQLLLSSQDVIHSFYVPAFRVKQDALPDRYTTAWFVATETGTYDLFCAEYCGAGHSRMRGAVVVMEPEAYQEWLGPGASEEPRPPAERMAAEGDELFARLGCGACHEPTSAVRAPRLDGLWMSEVKLRNDEHVVADEAYLREAILRPNAQLTAGYPAPSDMPSYEGLLSEEELAELVELIRSWRHGRHAGAAEQAGAAREDGDRPAEDRR